MGFEDAGDPAADVTYSTKSNADEVFHHRNTIWSWRREGLLIGFGGSGDTAVDVTY